MRHRRLQLSFLTATALTACTALIACSTDQSPSVRADETLGTAEFALQGAPGVTLNTVSYTIVGPASFAKSGSFDVSQSTRLAALIGPLPAGQGYAITLSANSVDGASSCSGSAQFDVVAQQTTPVAVAFSCHEGARTGSALVNGVLNICPSLDAVSANPAEVLLGTSIALSARAHDPDAGPAAIGYRWTAASGSLSDANVSNPTFTCLQPGSVMLSVSASDGDPLASCADSRSITVHCSASGGSGGASGGAVGGFGGGGVGGSAGSGGGLGGASSGGGEHLVVYRVGDGSGALVSSGNAVFVDEYTASGSLVRSIAMPLAVNGNNRRFVASGTATSEGLMTRSTDGHFVLLTGYDAPLPTTSLAGTTSIAVPRIVGRFAADGTVDTSTRVTDGVSGNNPRSVASSDGNQIWFTGAAGGVRYLTFGNTAATTTQLSTTVTNLRQVGIFGSQLYVSDSSGSAVRLGAVGVGLPTTSGQTISNVPGFPLTGSPYSFYFADLDATIPGVDVLFVADDGSGVTKYSLVAGSWLANGTVGAAADAYRGLTATVNAGTVTLFATRKGGSAALGGGELVSLVDTSGYNGAFVGTPSLLVSAAANTAFRGVALAPSP